MLSAVATRIAIPAGVATVLVTVHLYQLLPTEVIVAVVPEAIVPKAPVLILKKLLVPSSLKLINVYPFAFAYAEKVVFVAVPIVAVEKLCVPVDAVSYTHLTLPTNREV